MRGTPTTGNHTLPGLELLRGLACVEVLLLHLPWLPSQFFILTHWVVGGWGDEAVIVFFVLSGYVIALSQEKNRRPFVEFMRARFRRLLPLYLLAILITIPLEAWLHPETRLVEAVLLHLSFLQYKSYYLFCDIPLWSLSFEFYFYLLYALTTGRRQMHLRQAWCLLGLMALAASSFQVKLPGLAGHLYAILAFSPVWLLGAMLIHEHRFPRFNLQQSLVLLGLVPLLKNLPTLVPPAGMPGLGALTSLIVGLLVTPLIICLARGGGAPRPCLGCSGPSCGAFTSC